MKHSIFNTIISSCNILTQMNVVDNTKRVPVRV